jgi:hypothetical protein
MVIPPVEIQQVTCGGKRMGTVLFKQLSMIIIIALAFQFSATALADQSIITTDRPSYNPGETTYISINETSNITGHVIDPLNRLTQLILTPSEHGYLTEYSPQQGVILGTYTILVSGDQFSETSEFDIRTLSVNTSFEQQYPIGDIVLSGNVTDAASQEPMNASVNITIDNLTISTYAFNGTFSANYSASSTGQKVVSITAIDNQNITGSTNTEFEVYAPDVENLTSSTPQSLETTTTTTMTSSVELSASNSMEMDPIDIDPIDIEPILLYISGYLSPTNNSGICTDPTNAYADEGGHSTFNGTWNIYSGYNFSLPSNATILAVNVKIDAMSTYPSEESPDSIKLQVSCDGGNTWLTQNNSQVLTDNQTSYLVNVKDWTQWTPAKINNDNIQVKVEDVGNNTVELDWIPIMVTYVMGTNNAPVLSPIGSQTINESELLTITLNATDSNNDTITYATNATFGNLSDNVFTWTTNSQDSGTYYVEFEVSDGTLNDTETVTITVINDNRPDINCIADSPDPVLQGGTINITANVTDDQGVDSVWVQINGTNYSMQNMNDQQEQTLTLQPGSEGKDAYIDSSNGYTNYGTSTSIRAGHSSWRGLLEFDLSGLPANATITSAQVELYYYDDYTITGVGDLEAHLITRSWTETGVSWNNYDGTNSWSSTGGDFDSTVEDSVSIDDVYGWYGWDITRLVEGWYNGTYTNYGVIIKDGTNLNMKIFYSSDYSNSDYHPKLTINYTTVTASDEWNYGYDTSSLFPGTYDYTVYANDTSGFEAVPQTTNFTVEANEPPALSSIGPQSVNENETLTITLNATDPNGYPITYGTNATFGNLADNIFTWTPGYDYSGTYYVEFNVSDGTLVDNEIVAITVDNTNRAPVLTAIGDQSLNESETLTITLSATDPDGDALTYGTNATFGSIADNVFTWITAFEDSGTYYVKFEVSDGTLSNTETVTITVVNDNNPEINSVADSPDPVLQGENINITANVTDDFGIDSVWVLINGTNYSMQSMESQEEYRLTIQPGSEGKDAPIFYLYPNINYGTFTTIWVGKVNWRGGLEFDLSTLPANATINSAELELYYHDDYTTTGAEDLEAHRITRSWTEAGVTWNSYDGTNSWTSAGGDFDPTVEDMISIDDVYGWYGWNITNLVTGWHNGTYTNYGVMLKGATDLDQKGFYSSDYSNSDYHPKLTINYTTGTASDEWNYIHNTASLLPGTYDYTVYANDTSESEAVPQTANFTISNEAPVLSPIGSQTINESESLTITLNATDSNNDTITYATNATFGNLNDNVFTWTTDFDDSGTYYVEFNVSDGNFIDSEVISITVSNTNRAPVLSIASDNMQYVAPAEAWNLSYGGSSNDYAYSVKQTDDDGYVIAGQTRSFGAGSSDAWMIKTDANGTEEFNKTYGGSFSDYAYSIKQTNDDGYIVAGQTSSFGAGSSDAWLVKTDTNGNEEWNQTFGRNVDDYARSVMQTDDGGYAFAGRTSLLDESYQFKDYAWLVKTDSNGIEEWNQTFGDDDGSDYAYSIMPTSDNGYIIAGETSSFGKSNRDAWLIKTDANGNEEWNQTFDGYDGSYSDEAHSAKQTDDGGYIIAGEKTNLGGSISIWMIKTDSNGNMTWNQTFGNPQSGKMYDVWTTNDGGYIITGNTESSAISFKYDGYVLKTDSQGNELWNKTVGGNDDDYLYSLTMTSDEEFIAVGDMLPADSGYTEGWMVKLEAEPVLVEVNETELLSITLNVTDPDEDTITYSTNASFGALTSNVFTWTPGYEDSGTYYVEFNATDGNVVDSKIVTITVNETYIDVNIIKSIEEGAVSDSYNITLNLTNNAESNMSGIKAYDLIPANFTITDPVPNYNGSQSNIYYWSLDLVPGESKTVTYVVTGNENYYITDLFRTGVTYS